MGEKLFIGSTGTFRGVFPSAWDQPPCAVTDDSDEAREWLLEDVKGWEIHSVWINGLPYHCEDGDRTKLPMSGYDEQLGAEITRIETRWYRKGDDIHLTGGSKGMVVV